MMKKTVFIWLILISFGACFLHAQVEPLATLEITFTGLRSNKGLIALGVHTTQDGWHKKPEMIPNWKKENVVNGSMTVRIENLKYGTYAITMLDDENGNLEMDHTMGIPREGFGFSRNPRVRMSTPKYEECAFVIDQPLKKISIEVVYLGKGT